MQAWSAPTLDASSNAAVPNPRSADRYRSVGHLVPVRRERLFIYLKKIYILLFFFFIHFAILSLFYMP